MLAVGDLDRHFARETRQLLGSRVRHNSDSQLWFAARHRGAVLKREGAVESMQLSADALDRDITGRSINGRACGQHLAIADGFEIAVKLLVNCHSAQGRIRRFVVLRGQLYFKRSASISRHNILLLSFLLNWSLNGGL